jgi:hypothetical protein
LIIQRAVEDEFDAWLGRARYERRPDLSAIARQPGEVALFVGHPATWPVPGQSIGVWPAADDLVRLDEAQRGEVRTEDVALRHDAHLIPSPRS